jgi:hypothetical protein
MSTEGQRRKTGENQNPITIGFSAFLLDFFILFLYLLLLLLLLQPPSITLGGHCWCIMASETSSSKKAQLRRNLSLRLPGGVLEQHRQQLFASAVDQTNQLRSQYAASRNNHKSLSRIEVNLKSSTTSIHTTDTSSTTTSCCSSSAPNSNAATPLHDLASSLSSSTTSGPDNPTPPTIPPIRPSPPSLPPPSLSDVQCKSSNATSSTPESQHDKGQSNENDTNTTNKQQQNQHSSNKKGNLLVGVASWFDLAPMVAYETPRSNARNAPGSSMHLVLRRTRSFSTPPIGSSRTSQHDDDSDNEYDVVASSTSAPTLNINSFASQGMYYPTCITSRSLSLSLCVSSLEHCFDGIEIYVPTVRPEYEGHIQLLERLALPKLETPKSNQLTFSQVQNAPEYELVFNEQNPLDTQRDPYSILASPRYIDHPIARYISFVKVCVPNNTLLTVWFY